MQIFTFMYETESGDIGEYSCEATTLLDAKDETCKLCPEAISACIEIHISSEAQ